MTYGRAISRVVIPVIAIGMVLYHLIATQYLLVGPYPHQLMHLCFGLLLVFLATVRDTKSHFLRGVTPVLILLSVVVTAYIFIFYDYLEACFGFPDLPALIIGIVLVIIVIEGTRQSWGPILPIIAFIFILYFLLGHLVPGPLWHYPLPLRSVVTWLGIGFQGIFGVILGCSANFIFLFIVFGALLKACGGARFFLEMGKLAGRLLRGGPGQTAVVGSSLLGMVTGVAMANVALTGAFTIPLMKKVGYKPETAGAIEATASTGGQIMPPVMGASAFLMAGITGISYARIMLAGIIPALFYYLAVGMGVQAVALQQKIQPFVEKVDTKLLVCSAFVFIIPLGVIVTLLLLGFTPGYAAFYAVVTLLATSFILKETRPSWQGLAQGLVDGAITGGKIGIACACVGMMAQVLTTTGLGVKGSQLVIAISGGNLLITLVLTMILSIILGIGVPTSAAYLLVAILTAPVLVQMGVGVLQAHFFCFYFAIISALTPPVAMAAIAGAGIAGANYFRTGVEAVKLAIAGFIIPYLIVFIPVLLLDPMEPVSATLALISIALALVALPVALFGYFHVAAGPLERIAFTLAAGVLLGYAFSEVYALLVTGMALFTLLMIWQWRRRRTEMKADL